MTFGFSFLSISGALILLVSLFMSAVLVSLELLLLSCVVSYTQGGAALAKVC